MKKLYILIVALVLFPFFIIQAQTIFPVPKYPYETCIVDYDLDGDNDILVGCNIAYEDDSIVFFINDGWGNLEQQQFAANGAGFLYCVDLTNDKYPDILSRDGDSIFFYENNYSIDIGTGHFIRDNYGNPYVGGIADFNMDGTFDILYYDIAGPWGWGVLFNNGDNTFTDSAFVESNETWQGTHLGDLNNDKSPDILITTLDQSESVKVLYNYYPDFNEQVIATPEWNPGYIINVDNEFLNDVLLVKLSYFGATKIVNMLNEEDHFQACDTLVFENGTDIRNIGDYNLDGYDDLSMIVFQANNNPIQDSIYIYFNDQNCGYTLVQSVFMGEYAWLPTINSGDLNADGYPELVIQGYHAPLRESIRVLWNDGTGHFIDTNSVYVGEKDIQFQQQVSLYPNPFSKTTTIQFNLNSTDFSNIQLKIFDQVGREIKQIPVENAMEGLNSIEINMQGLPAGIYYYSLFINGNMTDSRKMVMGK